MGTLTGRLIRQYVERGDLGIDPFDELRVEPASYDAGIGSPILASPLGPTELGEVIQLTSERQSYDIRTGQMVAVISQETFSFPLDLVCGNFGIRSHFARRGLISFGGAQLDPGWRGRIIMCLQNVGPEPIPVTLGESFFTIQFDRLEEPAEEYAGPHQDQLDFPPDQVAFILSARTTSLAEIPRLRSDIEGLRMAIEDLHDIFPDPDEGLEIRPEIRERLLQARSETPMEAADFWARMGL